MTRVSLMSRPLIAVLVLALAAVLAVPRAQASPGMDSYIVTLRPGAATATATAAAEHLGGRVTATYHHVLHGFAVRLPAAAAQALAGNPNVASVEPDATVRMSATQSSPPWGIDRIDQRTTRLDSRFTYTATGTGVTAYVLDTGVRGTHTDFGGRVSTQYNAFTGAVESPADCQGHGTHVADTLGGSTYGAAKRVGIVSVKVLDCTGNGAASVVIAGLDWVAAQHAAGSPAVANLSLQETDTTVMSALDTAVQGVINDGVTTVVAAGNQGGFLGLSGGDACKVSPARLPAAITVSATDTKDNRSSLANYGSCVDLFAPGVNIVAASNSSDTGTATKSGTSMSTPHVAGIVAMYLQTNTTAAPATVASWIATTATTGVVKSAGSGSPNRLAYTGGL